MLCTECDGKTIVVDTNKNEYEIYRRRKCTQCGHQFYTTEKEIDEDSLTGLRYIWCNLAAARRKKAFKEMIEKSREAK